MIWVALYVLTPPVVLFNIVHPQITADVGPGIALGWTAPALTGALGHALGTRVLDLVVAPALLVALAAPLIDLPAPFLLLAAMPAGLTGLVVAAAYGLDLGLQASAVTWSTALAGIAAVTVPLMVGF